MHMRSTRSSGGFPHAQVPVHEQAHLFGCVPLLNHAGDEILVLQPVLGRRFGVERNDRKQILRAREDLLLNHRAQLLVGRPRNVSSCIGGACALVRRLVSGKTLMNLDSDDVGSFIVGCAGGKTTFIHLPCSKETLPPDHDVFRLSVSGLQGGHSGVEINKHLANANKILVRALDRIVQNIPIRLITLKGGTARNAIARDAEVTFACPKGMETLCREHLATFEREVRSEYSKSDAGLSMSLEPSQRESDAKALSPADSAKIIEFLMALPHGVIYMSANVEGFVETSTNLAVIDLKDDGLRITTLQRSNGMSRLDEIDRRIEAIARLAGAEINFTEGYPAWQPDMNSPLLARALNVYESLFKQKPVVEMIHAGLECGIIGDRCGGLDMLSFGPTIKGAHSPDEKLYIPSVERVRDFLIELLQSL